MDVSIIIINYNTKELTTNCISSIYRHTYNISYEIIVVDNGSCDGSKEFFEKSTNLKYIYSEKNLGFGKANNLGARYASGKYLLLLNSDTLLIENSIVDLYNFFEENNLKLNLGIAGCILCDENLNHINTAGFFPKVNFYILDYLNKFFKTGFKTYKSLNFDKTTIVDMVSGADMFLRRDLFEELNGFDESFFLYFEETDLQKRIYNSGRRNYIINSSKIIHLEGGSLKINNWKRNVIQTSQTQYFRKNESKHYFKYVMFEMLCLPIRFLNTNYSLSENLDFCLKNIKTLYENSVIRK